MSEHMDVRVRHGRRSASTKGSFGNTTLRNRRAGAWPCLLSQQRKELARRPGERTPSESIWILGEIQRAADAESSQGWHPLAAGAAIPSMNEGDKSSA